MNASEELGIHTKGIPLDLRGKLGRAPVTYTFAMMADKLEKTLRHGEDSIAVRQLRSWDLIEKLQRSLERK
jgi:hypothetical protein